MQKQQSKWTSFLFRTLAGKTYSANKVSLYFQDPALEKEYRLYLMSKWFQSFRYISYLVPPWSALLLALFKAFGYFDIYGPFAYFIPILATVWGVICTILVKLAKKEKLLKYLETIDIVCSIVYVDWTIGVLSAYITATTPPGETTISTLEWICILTTTFAVCLRRRIPATMFSMAFTIVFDLITALAIKKFSAGYYLAHNLSALITEALTVFIFVYGAEYSNRLTFLSEKEYESWKLNIEDLKFDKLIGAGTFGEVFLGSWKDYKVAIKKIIPKKDKFTTVSSSTGDRHKSELSSGNSQLSIPAKLFLTRMMERIRGDPSLIEQQKEEAAIFEKFEFEIRLMCSLRHPNIVTFIGAYLQRPDMLLVTEFCENGSLFDYIGNPNRKMDLTRKMDFCLGIAHGLQHLHSQTPPILHRDFKSLNILLDQNFAVKICDFGLCDFAVDLQKTISKSGKSKHDRTKTSLAKSHDHKEKLVGTIPWVAPEIFQHYPHSEKSDIYSFAIVLWEIFAEAHPYMEELDSHMYKVEDLVRAIVKKDFRPRVTKYLDLGFYPAEAISIMRKCWKRIPAERPSWIEILTALEMSRVEAMKHLNPQTISVLDDESLNPSSDIGDLSTPASTEKSQKAYKSPSKYDVSEDKGNVPSLERHLKITKQVSRKDLGMDAKRDFSPSSTRVSFPKAEEQPNNEQLQFYHSKQINNVQEKVVSSQESQMEEGNVVIRIEPEADSMGSFDV